mmetsp:Transcript_10288/g.24657  ORF Transcript_10288/g.24657 Transcript_10288/m.24657 type:complete len:666 (+) Transcript_10288:179-2176(+)
MMHCTRRFELAPLLLALLPLTDAFSATIHARSTLRRHDSHRIDTSIFRSSQLPTSLSMTETPDDEEEETNDPFDNFIESMVDDIKSSSRQTQPMSKGKWKRKRYLWIQDVQNLIEKNDPKAVKKAEEMVKRIKKKYEHNEWFGDQEDMINMDQKAYNLWIHAIAKSNFEDAGRQAEEVLHRMRADNIPPNANTYTSIMDAYAKNHAPERAEELMFQWLEEMESGGGGGLPEQRASEVTCDTLLNAWAKQGTLEGAERAQLILYRLEEFQNEKLHPTTISYTTVMNAWARVGSTEGAEKAEALLRRMLKGDARDKKHRTPVPDTVAFNSAMDAWAKSGDPNAGVKAASILETMKAANETQGGIELDCHPDIITYNIVLSAWSHSGRADAAPQTEKIVQQMEKAAKSEDSDGATRPSTISYNTILHAWSKSDMDMALSRAEKVLNYMLKSGRKEIAPDAISFTCVMDAWAKSKEPHKAAKIRKMLDQMLHTYKTTRRPALKPCEIPFNTVLNACAFSSLGTSEEERREALQIAVATYKEIRQEGVEPTTVTYGNMIKCIANLVPQGEARTRMALQVFGKCCEEGKVGNLVWNEVRRAVPGYVLDKTCRLKKKSGNMELRDLPRQWKQKNRYDKNAPKSKRPEKPQKPKRSPNQVSIIETAGQSGRDI